MKVVNYGRYIDDAAKVSALRPSHRAFMAELIRQGRLVAGGPFVDGSGALFVYNVDDLAEAETIVHDDPYTIGGAIAAYKLAHWHVVMANPSLIEPSPAD